MIIDEIVKEIIAKKLEMGVDEISDDASLLDDLGVDSIEIVELILTMEGEFGIFISEEDTVKIQTVRDAIECIKEHDN